jgi:hypothetical protein
MSKKIIILESQYKRVFLNEQVSSEEQLKKQKEELKDWFLKNGWPSNIIDMEGKSQEEALARTIVNGMDKLNRVIAEKVISEVKGNYSVCVKGFKGCRNYNDGRYYMATDFSDLVKNTSGKKIGDYRVSDVVYNSTLYFDSNEVREHILKQFKYNKNAGSSDKFPNGWWSFFKDYYGSGNYNEILNRIKSIKPSDIKSSKETLNQYKEYTGIFDGIKDCFSDYHCVLDVASIATLAIPGVGLAVSAGLDFINAASYGVEGATAKTSEERNAAYLAGGLTLFGGMFGGGVSQTKRLITKGNQTPKIYNYVDDVMVRVEKELPVIKNLSDAKKNSEVAKIYKETAEKYGLTNSDVLVAHDILKDFSKIDPKVAKIYTDALTKIDSRIGRANLTKIAKEKSFQNLVLKNNGDVITSLKSYMKTKAGKEALIEGGLFVVLSEVLEIPEVQKWIGEKYNYLTRINRTDIRGLVEKEGYDWGLTKELFSSSGSVEDNTLLTKAWSEGWRPSEDGYKSIEWLIKNSKYQTKGFKKKYGSFGKDEKIIRKIAPENPEDREEGVKYYDNKEELDAFSKMDDDITEEELDAAAKALDELFK